MKFLILFAALVAAVSAISYEAVLLQDYDLYKARFNKTYPDFSENTRRFEAYLKNKYEVDRHNLKFLEGEYTEELALNQFSDWFPNEIDEMYGYDARSSKESRASGSRCG